MDNLRKKGWGGGGGDWEGDWEGEGKQRKVRTGQQAKRRKQERKVDGNQVVDAVFNQIKEEGSLINQLKPMLSKIMETFYWHPARMMYYFTMIDLFTLCGEYQKSQNLINQYKHLVHSQYDILLREGVILYKMQQHDLAIEKFNKALKINSKCQESRRYLELLA
mgnify:CR=1 FL=1